MSHFVYKAKRASGETYHGENDFADRYELYRMIRESGEELLDFKERKISGGLHLHISFGALKGRVKTVEKINFARNLGSMLEAGLPLSRALSVIDRQTRNKAFKATIEGIMAEIDKGTTFADALRRYPKVFPPIFVSMVHAGEQSGTLAESLRVTAVQMDSAYTLTKRIRGALMYPGVIVTAMVIIAILMFIFVIPTLLKTFTDLNVALPPTTQFVLEISNLLQHDGILVLLAAAILGGALYWWSRQAAGKNFFHSAMLKIPVIGGLIQEVNAARTARTMSSLLTAGVGVVESMTITAEVVQNVHFRKVLTDAAESIKKGGLLSTTFAENIKLYPVFFSEMVNVGEETGKTGEMLLGVAKYYEDDVEQKTKDMSTIIEPFLILVIGGAVGFFAVSMIQPMYSLVDAIH